MDTRTGGCCFYVKVLSSSNSFLIVSHITYRLNRFISLSFDVLLAESKTLKEEKTEEFFENLKATSIGWAVDVMDPRGLSHPKRQNSVGSSLEILLFCVHTLPFCFTIIILLLCRRWILGRILFLLKNISVRSL